MIGNTVCEVSIFTCGEADRSSGAKCSFFFLSSVRFQKKVKTVQTSLVERNVLSCLVCQISKEGQNIPNKHGIICSLGHKFQV